MLAIKTTPQRAARRTGSPALRSELMNQEGGSSVHQLRSGCSGRPGAGGAGWCQWLGSANGSDPHTRAETPGLVIPTPAAPAGTASAQAACGPPAPLPARIGVRPVARLCGRAVSGGPCPPPLQALCLSDTSLPSPPLSLSLDAPHSLLSPLGSFSRPLCPPALSLCVS